jgi:phage terminase large subunit GpA-like protein
VPAIWTQADRRAWKWPDKLKPSEWAETNRILPGHVTAEPGPWRGARAPYLAGITDAISEPGVEQIVVIKAAQVGFSESLRNLLGFFIDHDPGPCLIVMPDQKSAEDLIEERVKPLLEYTPAVKRHVSVRAWDVKKTSIRLDTMSIYMGWSGSSQSLASRPIRYLFIDEPDNYQSITSGGADPISQAMKRVTTYLAKGRARVIIGGTPKTRLHNISNLWEACSDQRHYYCPCPHCGHFQPLAWKSVKYAPAIDGETRKAHASRILDTGAAWFDCQNQNCGGRITDEQKLNMLARGLWVGSDQVVTPDGRLAGPDRKRSRRIGFHLPATYSPWVKFAQLASEWIEAQGNTPALCDFVNQRLGEPFEEQRAKVEPSMIAEKAKGAPEPMNVPAWARLLIATADTQGNNEKDGYFWYVIRAWGYDYRSQLIDYGVCHSKEELTQRCLSRPIPAEGRGNVVPQMLVIDSGGPRWSEIYQLAQSDPRIHPSKGAAKGRQWMVDEKPQKKHAVVLWLIDTDQSKDLLHRLINDPDRSKWLPHNQINDDYCRQMCAESKIYNPTDRREEWVEIVKNNNHILDCYDDVMEVLTHAGWKKFADLTGRERLATVNRDTNEIQFQKPQALIAKQYKGPMIQIGGAPRQRIDLLVTPTHRMVVFAKHFDWRNRSSKPFDYPQVIKLARDLTIWDSIKLSGEWKGRDAATRLIRARGRRASVVVDAENLARLFGWYVAEGYCRRTKQKDRPNSFGRSVFIYQNRGDKRESIRKILAALPWTFSETDRGFNISSDQAYWMFCKLGNKYTKRVPNWIKEASPRIIRAFIKSAVDGDGWRDGSHEVYATVSRGLANDIQELYVKLGFSSSMRIKKPATYTIRGRSGTTVTQYHVHRKNCDRASLRDANNKPNFKTVPYDGMVYCATVLNGTLIVRRNGKVAVCGNCEAQQCAAAWRLGAGVQEPHFEQAPPPNPNDDRDRPPAWISQENWQVKTW